jgi:NAD+ synthase (glutamine-hydrolysing)
MRVAIAQINPRLGAFSENSEKILSFTRRALEKRCDLVVFSEMSLFGYPAYDLLEREEVVENQLKELKKLELSLPLGITAIFGAVIKNKKTGKPFHNVAVVARKGKKTQYFAKQLLPSYDVFDDTRFFSPGEKTGVTVCEDMWARYKRQNKIIYPRDPFAEIKSVDLIVNISASPFSTTQINHRLNCARFYAKKKNAPFIYVNQVGGQDELIFDGRSFVLNRRGEELVRAAACEEDLVVIDLKNKRTEYRPDESNEIEHIRQALVLGIRDFMRKTNQKSLHLGLSGGIDSSVVAALAVDALGPNRVTGFLLPGPFSSKGSVTDAKKLAQNLKIKTYEIEISSFYELVKQITRDCVASISAKPDALAIMDQNIQARARAMLMMTFANAAQSMLLCTANKSEMAAGYGTIYGDLCGGLAPIGDLVKQRVYQLARLYNSQKEIIPEECIKKDPSAELAPNQKDQDTLPPYEKLDSAVSNLVEKQLKPKGKVEENIWTMLLKSEWKRWQTPPVLRVTDRAFGKGRRYPISAKTD